MIKFEKIEDVLCFTISKKITDEDYKDILIPETEKALEVLENMGKLKRLKMAIIVEKSFTRPTLHAIIDDISYGLKHRKDFNKIGITGKHYKYDKKLSEIGSKIISGEIKVFDTQKEMFDWLK